MMLPADERLGLLCDRYSELDEFTGCRTAAEREEMQQIAEAILPRLIRVTRMLDQFVGQVERELEP